MATASNAKVGDWVEVRSLAEILSTLDDSGAIEALPFMPEMAQFAGKRFRIVRSAHKTCDPTGASDLRRMKDAVHLETRCDGSAHGGCEARCLIFWKNAWLKPVDGPTYGAAPAPAESLDLSRLHDATRTCNAAGAVRYKCQTTAIVQATTPLPLTELRQYVEDMSTGNVTLGKFIDELARIFRRSVVGRALKLLGGGGVDTDGAQPAVAADAGHTLDLQPGELVQVRPAEEILAMLDKDRKHHGLSVEDEMLRHCGKTYRVAARINRMIDEKSGRMIKFANECVALQGVMCSGLDNPKRIFCPRSPLYYWREAWLRRVDDARSEKPANAAPRRDIGAAPAIGQ